MNKQQIEELRQKYIDNPPEGMTAQEVITAMRQSYVGEVTVPKH